MQVYSVRVCPPAHCPFPGAEHALHGPGGLQEGFGPVRQVHKSVETAALCAFEETPQPAAPTAATQIVCVVLQVRPLTVIEVLHWVA